MKESFPRTKMVIIARLLIAAVIVLTALIGGLDVERPAIVILGVIAAALTVVYLLWHASGGRPRLLMLVQCAVDVIFITLLAYFSGGLASPFKLLYFLPVIVAAGRLGLGAGLAAAGGAVAGHIVLTLTGPSSWSYLMESGAVAEIVTLFISLLLVALLEGHLARKAGESEDKLTVTRSELDTAELRIADILDGISSGLALVDSGGTVAYLNRAGEAILGVPGEGARGKDYRLGFADVPAFCERIAAALDAGRPEVRAEFFVKRRGGGSTPVGLSTSILRSGEGEDRGVIAIFQDLTKVRQMEERLRHDDRLSALGEFAAGVAHEIRNPLYAIKGSIDLLKETIEPRGDEIKLIELVSREADRLNTLLQDVLQYGRMESGERESVRLDALLQEVNPLMPRTLLRALSVFGIAVALLAINISVAGSASARSSEESSSATSLEFTVAVFPHRTAGVSFTNSWGSRRSAISIPAQIWTIWWSGASSQEPLGITMARWFGEKIVPDAAVRFWCNLQIVMRRVI